MTQEPTNRLPDPPQVIHFTFSQVETARLCLYTLAAAESSQASRDHAEAELLRIAALADAAAKV